ASACVKDTLAALAGGNQLLRNARHRAFLARIVQSLGCRRLRVSRLDFLRLCAAVAVMPVRRGRCGVQLLLERLDGRSECGISHSLRLPLRVELADLHQPPCSLLLERSPIPYEQNRPSNTQACNRCE